MEKEEGRGLGVGAPGCEQHSSSNVVTQHVVLTRHLLALLPFDTSLSWSCSSSSSLLSIQQRQRGACMSANCKQEQPGGGGRRGRRGKGGEGARGTC